MQNETRVNLKHLLEDIRDSYTSPLEEVILVELIANALDSKASDIHFTVDPENKFIRCADNGVGMKRPSLREYHNIAASAKMRGVGIGFAGVGAKLSLLIAEKVVTESKGGHGTKSATEWSLTGSYRAPWKFVPSSGAVSASRGTSVSIYFRDAGGKLLDKDFVGRTIAKHFYPLLSENFYKQFLRYFYKKPIAFFVNDKKVELPDEKWKEFQHWFPVTVGRSRRAEGLGFLVKIGQEPNWLGKLLGEKTSTASLSPGLWISTFGKVIKGGWEWLGVTPKNANGLVGLVEIPALSLILTTNKNDFLSDGASLKRYYRYRKAIQEAVLPILRSLGEDQATGTEALDKTIRPLNRAIVGALNRLIGDFPELESLLGSRRIKAVGKTKKEEPEAEKMKAVGTIEMEIHENKEADGVAESKSKKIPAGVIDEEKQKLVRAKTAGLKLALSEIDDTTEILLGRVVEDTLTVNTKHPAWRKAKQSGMEEYHVIVTVAAVLSQFLESEKSPQDFLNRLLMAWASEISESEKAGKLF